jgi:hypothetical protein
MVVDELAVALAIFCKLHEVPYRQARKELDITPRAHFDEATVWADSNAKVIALIDSDPSSVVQGGYTLSEGRGWFSRLFGLGRRKGGTAATDDDLEALARDLDARKQTVDEKKAKRLADLRELVDESFEAG